MTVAERIKRERDFSVKLVREHAGDWVAVRNGTLIAYAAEAKALDQQLTQERLPYRTFRVSRAGGVTLLPAASA